MLGSHNPLPMSLGGSPSRFEKTFNVLQRLVGANGSSRDENEIEYVWREAKANGLAAIESFDERAAMQFSPLTATDHIPLFEDVLKIPNDDSLSNEQRRQRIVPLYSSVPEAFGSAIQANLQLIDPTLSTRVRPWENSTTSMIGRWYANRVSVSPDERYDQGLIRTGTDYPNYSDEHTLVIEYPLGNGVAPNKEQLFKREQVHAMLTKNYPSWCDFHIVHHIGFTLDSSLLDATGFGS